MRISISVAAMILLRASAFAQEYHISPLVFSGQIAPGEAGYEGVQRFSSVGQPSIDERGRVGFGGSTIRGDSRTWGGWIWDTRQINWIYQQDVAEPGGAMFGTSGTPVPYDAGVLLNTALPSVGSSVFGGNIDGLTPILRNGEIPDGFESPIRHVQSIVGSAGHLGLSALFEDDSEAIWLLPPGTTTPLREHLVATSGDLALELDVRTTTSLTAEHINSDGQLIGSASIGRNETLWEFTSAGRRLLAETREELAPGTDRPFVQFHDGQINDLGATIFPGVTSNSRSGVWRLPPDAEEATPLALSETTLPGFDVEIESVDLRANLNNRNEVAVTMTLGSDVEASYLISPDGEFTLLASEGAPVPALDGWIYQEPRLAHLNDNGLAVFQSSIVPQGGTFRDTERALIVRQPDGTHDTLFRTGGAFEITPGDIRTVEVFQFDDGAQLLNNQNQLVTQMRFEDGLSAIVAFDLNRGSGERPVTSSPATPGIATEWQSSLGGQWIDDSHWDAGVPNGAGHVAVIGENPRSTSSIALPENGVTLGELHFRSGVDRIRLSGDNGLRLAAAEDLVPTISSSDGGRLVIGAPVSSTADWVANVGDDSILELEGPLNGGSVTKVGNGELRLLGDSGDWGGTVSMTKGRLVVGHAEALGTTSAATKINADTELLIQIRGLPQVHEPIVLNGGTLRQSFGPELHGPLTVTEDSVAHGVSIHGELTGTPDLTFDGRSSIHGPTVYDGMIRVAGQLEVHDPNSLGTATSPTIVQSDGSLATRVPMLEPVVVESGGSFNIQTGRTYEGPVTLAGGGVRFADFGNLAGPINIRGSGSISGFGTVSSRIEGDGEVRVGGGRPRFTGEIVEEGLKFVVPRGGWLTLATETDGTLPFEVGGHLEIVRDTSFSELVLLSGFQLSTPQGAALTIDQLPIVGGTYDIRLHSTEPIRITELEGPNSVEFKRLSGYNEDIFVDSGSLFVTGPTGLGWPTGATHVASEDAELVVRSFSDPSNEDIFLDNSTGIDHRGGLRLYGAHLAGDLHLGEHGSLIDVDNGVISGVIHGGDLSVQRNQLQLTSGRHTYTGRTRLLQAELRLSEAGRLAETSGIDLVSYAGSEASLVFDNLIAGQDDRVADSIDIHSWGGGIRTIGAGRPQPDTERLGQLTLNRSKAKPEHWF